MTRRAYTCAMVLLTLLTMAGCKEEVDLYGADIAIDFTSDGVGQNGTRADESLIATRENLPLTAATDSDNPLRVGVFGYHTGKDDWTPTATANFLYNQPMTVEAGSDDHRRSLHYSPMRYWPKDEQEKLSFWAYYPYSATGMGEHNITLTTDADDGVGTATGMGHLKYRMSAKTERHVDLLISTLEGNLTRSDYVHVGDDGTINIMPKANVSFKFRHALSQVRIFATIELYNDNSESNCWSATTANGASRDYGVGEAIDPEDMRQVTSTQVVFGNIYTEGRVNAETLAWDNYVNLGTAEIDNYDHSKTDVERGTMSDRRLIILAIPQHLSETDEPYIQATVKDNHSDKWARVTINLMDMDITWKPGMVYSYAFRVSLKPGDDIVLGPEIINTPFETEDIWAEQW